MKENDIAASQIIFITDIPKRLLPSSPTRVEDTQVLVVRDDPPQVVKKTPSRLSSLGVLLAALHLPEASPSAKQVQNPVYLKKSTKRRW